MIKEFIERQTLVNKKTRDILESLNQWVGELAEQLIRLEERMNNEQ